MPVLVLCSPSGFRLLMVRGVRWGWRGEGNAEGERGARPRRGGGKGRGERCAPGVRGGVAVGGARGGERGSRRVGLGSHQVWRVREVGRGCGGGALGTGAEPERPPPPPFHCDRRVRPRRRRRLRRGAGAGGGGGRRAVAGGGGRNRPQLGPGQPPPPPSSRSPGERAANPRRPLRARPGPGCSAPAAGRAFPLALVVSHPLFPFPLPYCDKFLKFDELAQ